MNAHFRPMQWVCSKDGCFNDKHRLDFSEFYDALPGRISFSDVDAITEVNSHALIMEWKSRLGNLPAGQRIMFERLTKGKTFSVLCVVKDPNTHSVTHVGKFFDGKWHGWFVGTNEDVFNSIKKWAGWAQSNRVAA
tara:strand:- start:412 stop:819 length:408 start_codon:yes stop_codon:yes gene_type:complete